MSSEQPQTETSQAINVLVGIPTGEKNVSTLAFLNWLRIAQRGHSMIGTSEGPPSLCRDYLVREFLKDTRFTHLLMLDSDHLHPVDIVERLTRWLANDAKPLVVSALNYQRKEPFRPAAFFFDGPTMGLMHLSTWPQGLVKVDAVGASALLVAREAFEKLSEPWFDFHYLPMGEGAVPRFIGEDIWFCKKLADAGISVYVDTTTTGPHLGDRLVGDKDFREWLAVQEPNTLTEHQIDTQAVEQETAKGV
jgi:hypothetical protein